MTVLTAQARSLVLDVDSTLCGIEGIDWLAEIRPRREEVDALARAYVDALAPGAVDAIARIRRAGVQVVLVSGGLRHALLRLAYALGLGPNDLHAVSIRFDALGAYEGYDTS